jgi:hypothetical protein
LIERHIPETVLSFEGDNREIAGSERAVEVDQRSKDMPYCELKRRYICTVSDKERTDGLISEKKALQRSRRNEKGE